MGSTPGLRRSLRRIDRGAVLELPGAGDDCIILELPSALVELVFADLSGEDLDAAFQACATFAVMVRGSASMIAAARAIHVGLEVSEASFSSFAAKASVSPVALLIRLEAEHTEANALVLSLDDGDALKQLGSMHLVVQATHADAVARLLLPQTCPEVCFHALQILWRMFPHKGHSEDLGSKHLDTVLASLAIQRNDPNVQFAGSLYLGGFLLQDLMAERGAASDEQHDKAAAAALQQLQYLQAHPDIYVGEDGHGAWLQDLACAFAALSHARHAWIYKNAMAALLGYATSEAPAPDDREAALHILRLVDEGEVDEGGFLSSRGWLASHALPALGALLEGPADEEDQDNSQLMKMLRYLPRSSVASHAQALLGRLRAANVSVASAAGALRGLRLVGPLAGHGWLASKAGEVVIDFSKHSDTDVRDAAMDCLLMMSREPPAALQPLAARLLAQAVLKPPAGVRTRKAREVAQVDDTRRAYSLIVLSGLGTDFLLAQEASLVPLLADASATVRAAAVRAVGMLGTDFLLQQAASLVPLMADESVTVRAAAIQTVGRFGPGLLAHAPALCACLEDSWEAVRMQALLAICAFMAAWDEPTVAAVVRRLGDASEEVRLTAAQAISERAGGDLRVADPAGLEPHVDAIATRLGDQCALVRMWALETMMALLPPSALAAHTAAIEQCTTHEDKDVQAVAKQVVATIGGRRSPWPAIDQRGSGLADNDEHDDE